MSIYDQYITAYWKDFPPTMQGQIAFTDPPRNPNNFPFTIRRINKIKHPYEERWSTGLMYTHWRKIWQTLE